MSEGYEIHPSKTFGLEGACESRLSLLPSSLSMYSPAHLLSCIEQEIALLPLALMRALELQRSPSIKRPWRLHGEA